MKIKVITVATKENEGLAVLRKSAANNGMDLTVLGLGEPWQGFGMKVILTRDYLRTLEGYTHFIFVDAYDTLFLKPVTDYEGGIVFSCEKHKWPDHDAPYPELKSGMNWDEFETWIKSIGLRFEGGQYTCDEIVNSNGEHIGVSVDRQEDCGSGEIDEAFNSIKNALGFHWQYLNSGSYIAPIDEYLAMVDKYPVDFADDDQRYFTNIYLNSDLIKLDTDCKLFQSYAFMAPGDFTLTTDKLINNITKTEPSIIHFNGKCLEPKIYAMINYSTLKEVQTDWADTPEKHKEIHEAFIERVNAVDQLNEHRTFVENNVFGFGERSFHWLWNLIVQELPQNFTFLEIGVLKGQTLSLVELLAKMQGKKAKRYGVTPLSTEGGVWESDYKKDIEFIHDKFGLAKDYKILNGLSEDPEILKRASKLKLDVLYIDGGHEERHITNDIENYSPLVKPGGYMIIDDCCNSFSMPFGYFQGIDAVTRVVDAMLSETKDWKFICSVVHNRVFKRL